MDHSKQGEFPTHRLLSTIAVILAVLAFIQSQRANGETEVPASHWWPEGVEQALARAGANRAELTRALREAPEAQRQGLQFLLENMPQRDLQSLSASFLLENIAQAYEAREKAPWGKAIPEEIFLNDVLPYASINERREDWRKLLHEKCAPLVKDCKTPAEAAQRLNEKLFGVVRVKYSTARKKADQSPSESMESGLASCTGLSILLIDACRSVGVPARLAGVPNWADNRGNHTWVEIWDQRWHFTGAAEPDPNGLDHTWFQADAAKAVKDSKEHAIYATSFKKTALPFPLAWAPGLDYVSAANVTDQYTGGSPANAGTTRLLVRVMDHPSGRRVAAKARVSDASDSTIKFEGISKDEKVDLNDMLSFALPQQRTYDVQVQSGDKTLRRQINCQTNDQQVVMFYLDSATAGSGSPGKPLTASQETALKRALADFFAANSEQQAHWKFDRSLESLLRKNEPAARRAAWEAYCAAPLQQSLKEDYDAGQVRFQNYLSPYTVKKVGEKPPGGLPLFIAMHGGGGAPKEVNDSQWKVMQNYYHDQPSVPGYLYVALRAPNDTWNGFYDDYVYPLVGNLIRQFLVFGEVDPNKVFIMGYSHGGYGAFAIGPKMPDHFAAVHASAAAPTDGETSAKTLRNTPFTYMIGENDHAYGRLERDRAFDEKIQTLRGDRGDIYPVTMEYKAGHGHTGLPDKEKIKEMYSFARDPAPRELTWEMTDGVIQNFFWLQVPKPGKHQEIDAACHDNRIVVTTTNVVAANVLLDSRLIDFKRPVVLEVNGRKTTRKLQPSLVTLCQTLMERGDPELAFTARVGVEF
jgi:transglutaminase-like putative cysteine protease/pimeloyl-ACP methyl ester carboxylesterase